MLTLQSIAGPLLAASLLCGGAGNSRAERFVASVTEERLALYFSVDQGAVQKLLPTGWVSTPGVGWLRDSNVALILSEGVAASDADEKPVPHPEKLAVLVVLAKNEQTAAKGAMLVDGFISPPQFAPGPYGVLKPASITVAKSSHSDAAGVAVIDERWHVATDAGDQLRFDISYDRKIGNQVHVETRFYSATKPEFSRTYKIDQVSYLAHTVADEATRARRVEFSSTGPQLAALFDGKQRLIAVAVNPLHHRRIFLPE